MEEVARDGTGRGVSRGVFALSPSLSIFSPLIPSSMILFSLSQPTPTSTRSSSADSAERRVVFPLCLPSHLFRLSSFSLPSCPLAPLIPSPFAYLVLPLVFAQPRLAPSLSFLLSSLLFFLLRGIGSSRRSFLPRFETWPRHRLWKNRPKGDHGSGPDASSARGGTGKSSRVGVWERDAIEASRRDTGRNRDVRHRARARKIKERRPPTPTPLTRWTRPQKRNRLIRKRGR